MRRLAWFGVWLTSCLLVVTMAQPVNLALATESPVSSFVPELISVVDPVATPADCSISPDRPNLSFPRGSTSSPFMIESFEDLQCMQQLVNNSVMFTDTDGTFTYRNGFHWQISSFDAKSQTIAPIGKQSDKTTTQFSGTVMGENGSATISDLTISGENDVGLFGVVSGPFLLSGVHLANVSVVGNEKVGAIIGHAAEVITINNCSVTGSVFAKDSQDPNKGGTQAGGLVGLFLVSYASQYLSLNNVSFTGSVKSGEIAGGLVGETRGHLYINNAIFDGQVTALDTYNTGPGVGSAGGVLGIGRAFTNNSDIQISQAAVRVHIGQGQLNGGLIGSLYIAFTNSFIPMLKVDNSVVLGSIASNGSAAGLVGYFEKNSSATFSSVISAVDLTATGVATGLINATSSATVELNSVLNLARVASSSDGTQSAAALVYSSSGQPTSFSSSQAYRWRGLSASVTAYHSFTDGEVSINNGGWIYNGIAVNCSNFSDLNFWNNSASMNLSTASGWNFSQISSGYLPTMNGKFADQPFTCMNEVIFPGISDITNVRFGFGERPLPVVGDSTISVHFFSPSAPDNPATYDIAYRFETSGSFYFDVFYDGNLVYCSLSSLDDWPLPEGGLMQGATISLRAAADPCVVPNFQFTLAKEEIQFLLKWTTEDTESLAVIYSNFGNLAGGVPPGVTATNLGYLETAIDHNLKLGLSTKGTYTITATGSFLGQGDTKSRPVARTQTWPNYLLVITQIGNIYFPDVFTSGNPSTTTYKTIIYKNNDNISVSQVRSVNESRYAAIRWLASVAVTEGSQSTSAGETTYRAQDPVNRGAMAQFLQKLSGFTDAQIKLIYQGHENQFADIASLYQSNPGRYYSILWLADTGITVGCNTEGTLFCPGNVVNRGAMAEFMRKFAGVAVTEAKTSPFPDVNLTAKDLKYDNSSDSVTVPKVSEVRMGAINWLASTEITLGSGSIGGVTAYRAQDAVNRGAMAEFMYKLALHVGSTPA